MSGIRTAEETKQDHIEAMGQELGSLYHVLWNELTWLYSKWGEYVELFGTKPSRIELLNKVAGHFFRIVQDSLWEDCLLHIARLTDPPKSPGGKENLTIRKFLELIEDKGMKQRIADLIDVADEKAKFCRDWRNRRIAHKDLSLALRSGAEPLQPASRSNVKDALSAITDVMNAVSLHFMDSETMFEGVGNSSGAVSLLYVLDDGLRAEQRRKEKLKSGKYHAEDYQPRDL